MKKVKEVVKVSANGNVTKKSQDLATVKIVKEISRDAKPKERGYIYKFQLDAKKLSAKDAKKLRSKLRRKLQAICNEIILANVKQENLNIVKTFLTFYKENYILNDLSLQSLTNSSDELKHQDINKVLLLAKKVKTKK